MWQNLKCCTITIPEIEDGNNNFDGIFSIENNYLNVWIQYSKKDSNYIQLINKMQSDKPFSIQIKNGENSSIIGFNCICNTPFSFHIYDTNSNNQKHIEGRYEPADELGLLSIKCELWTHGLINTTIDEKVFREIRFNMLYSEPWFNLNNDARIMNINDDIKIIFDCGKRQTWNHLTREYSEKKTGNIICQSEAGFSINDALEISIEIQTLIRYMSDISYPLGQIKLQLKSEYISDLSGPPTPIDIYGNWVLPSVANKPKPLAYVNMPYYLTDLTENGFCNWIREWKKAKAAIINAENARNKVLEIQILEYVKSFDSLTSILLPKKLATANNNEFEKWKN